MAGRVPATHPWSVGPLRRLYNRRCVGGRDTPGHDGKNEFGSGRCRRAFGTHGHGGSGPVRHRKGQRLSRLVTKAKNDGENGRQMARCPQSNKVARRRLILSATYSASAWIVEVGFTPPDVTQMLPSTMNRFLTSWQRPQALTTDRSGSLPMRAVPSRWPGLLSTTRAA